MDFTVGCIILYLRKSDVRKKSHSTDVMKTSSWHLLNSMAKPSFFQANLWSSVNRVIRLRWKSLSGSSIWQEWFWEHFKRWKRKGTSSISVFNLSWFYCACLKNELLLFFSRRIPKWNQSCVLIHCNQIK